MINFNGNKIITGSSCGMLLVTDDYRADRIHKWSTQSQEIAPWYQHGELGYNYCISNLVIRVVPGQWKHLEEHIQLKKEIFLWYPEGLSDLPISMNPEGILNNVSNWWLNCLLQDQEVLCESERSERGTAYRTSSA